MRSLQAPTGLVQAGWLVIVVAMIAVLAIWVSQIAGALTAPSRAEALPSPPPVHAIPTVVTEYSTSGPLNKSQLCAELAPRVNSVIVENPLGYIDTTIQC
jgi:hypothetical protein